MTLKTGSVHFSHILKGSRHLQSPCTESVDMLVISGAMVESDGLLNCLYKMYIYLASNMDDSSGVTRVGGGFGVFKTPPKFQSFDKVEPGCKLSGKCLVFLFQHPN